ncbi:hypothetical protein YSA_08915 [Pseudomonas putida ND6]|uniref:Uncharacterized protein n=1 Tax=Pseudomonas putida ND6 TaxID=231023 RepID=I3V1G7_PSEPU|nr:hypothetical protein YSA_08915 [Pseudomonas putida ND6]
MAKTAQALCRERAAEQPPDFSVDTRIAGAAVQRLCGTVESAAAGMESPRAFWIT